MRPAHGRGRAAEPGAAVLLLLGLTLAQAGCRAPGCPEGQVLGPDAECVTPDDDDLIGGDDDAGDDDAGDDDAGDDDAGDDDAGDDDDTPPGPQPVDPPPPPVYPAVVGTVSITMVTADVPFAGTDENAVSVCLTDTDCYRLDIADINDLERAETGVYYLEGQALPRADIDRVEIRSVDGVDRWEPSCLAVQLDGEPVYCQELSGLQFGEEPDELTSWEDPQGLHMACETCFPDVLTHGPMLGALEPDGARVWARTDATRLVGLRVSASEDLQGAPVVAWAWPSPSTDYAVTLQAGGLSPDTGHWYGIEVDGALMAGPFPFTTAPAPGTSGTLRFAFGSCSKVEDQPIFATIAAEEPALFVFAGDNHYGNTSVVDALRWNYRWSLERPERAALARTTSTIATWDDHDYTGNNTDATAPGRANALRVFQEYWANPPVGTSSIPGTFFAQSHGDVDFFLLDDRYHRGLDDSILGGPQQQWLLDALSASTATFKFVLTGSQWTADGSNDSWASFVTQRDVILDHIRDARIDGVVLLSGDVHRSEFRVIERASVGGYDLPELTSSPLATTNSPCPLESEILSCADTSDYFIVVDLDTLALDPSLTARMIAVNGDEVASFTTSLSALTVP
jgi:alkaline phosphatase D